MELTPSGQKMSARGALVVRVKGQINIVTIGIDPHAQTQPVYGRLVRLALAFADPRAQDLDGIARQGRGALLPAFPQGSDVRAAADVHIGEA